MQLTLLKSMGNAIRGGFSTVAQKTKGVATRAAAIRFRGGQGVLSNPYTRMTFAQANELGYKGLPWVYRCVNVYGDAIGSARWQAYKINDKGEEILLPGHPLERLLENPNPHHSKMEFFSVWAIYIMLAGEAFWEVLYDRKKRPVYLYSLRPDWMEPLPDPDLFINGYKFDPRTGKPIRMENEDVVFFKLPSPDNEYRGLSPLNAGMRSIEAENRVTNWNNSLLENNAIPGGVLEVPASNLDATERAELTTSLEEEYSRENIHRPMVLWGGMKWQQMALSSKDLDFAGLKNLNKQEIHAVLGVPEELTNANLAAKYENKATARQMFWEDRVLPLLDWIASMINKRLAPLYGDGVLIRPDVSSHPAMIDAFMRKVDTARMLSTMGYPLNVINTRLALGMGQVAWGDVAWMPSSLMPVSNAQPVTEATNMPKDPELDAEEEDPKDSTQQDGNDSKDPEKDARQQEQE